MVQIINKTTGEEHTVTHLLFILMQFKNFVLPMKLISISKIWNIAQRSQHLHNLTIAQNVQLTKNS